jgi:hypothetical protein
MAHNSLGKYYEFDTRTPAFKNILTVVSCCTLLFSVLSIKRFRIIGGIGVIAPWWPIKAYRPCPNYIAKGGVYERSGQGLDEIAFGRDSTFER